MLWWSKIQVCSLASAASLTWCQILASLSFSFDVLRHNSTKGGIRDVRKQLGCPARGQEHWRAIKLKHAGSFAAGAQRSFVITSQVCWSWKLNTFYTGKDNLLPQSNSYDSYQTRVESFWLILSSSSCSSGVGVEFWI